MAVPISWCHQVSPNWNTLDSITSLSKVVMKGMLMISFGAKHCWISSLNKLIYCLMMGIPSEEWMLVYMLTASHVASIVPGGNLPRFFNCWTTW